MKKIILSFALAIITTAGIQAQTSTTTADVKVNVILRPTLSIEVNLNIPNDGGELEESGAVNLVYKNANDYANGITKTIPSHLKVSSIGSGYKVHAQVANQNLNRSVGEGAETMSGELVKVRINDGQERKISELNGKQEMYYNGGGNGSSGSVLNQELAVTYRAEQLNTEQIANLMGPNGAAARYTTTVTYTITTP